MGFSGAEMISARPLASVCGGTPSGEASSELYAKYATHEEPDVFYPQSFRLATRPELLVTAAGRNFLRS